MWHFHILAGACHIFGRDFVVSKLSSLRGDISSMFTGVDCAAQAWDCLGAAALELLGVNIKLQMKGLMAERDSACQRYLQSRFPSRCLFPDVLEWVDQWPEDGAMEGMVLKKTTFCLQHRRQCRVYSRFFMDVSGPPCVLWSRNALPPHLVIHTAN